MTGNVTERKHLFSTIQSYLKGGRERGRSKRGESVRGGREKGGKRLLADARENTRGGKEKGYCCGGRKAKNTTPNQN